MKGYGEGRDGADKPEVVSPPSPATLKKERGVQQQFTELDALRHLQPGTRA